MKVLAELGAQVARTPERLKATSETSSAESASAAPSTSRATRPIPRLSRGKFPASIASRINGLRSRYD